LFYEIPIFGCIFGKPFCFREKAFERRVTSRHFCMASNFLIREKAEKFADYLRGVSQSERWKFNNQD